MNALATIIAYFAAAATTEHGRAIAAIETLGRNAERNARFIAARKVLRIIADVQAAGDIATAIAIIDGKLTEWTATLAEAEANVFPEGGKADVIVAQRVLDFLVEMNGELRVAQFAGIAA
jgi:hypothetical protein